MSASTLEKEIRGAKRAVEDSRRLAHRDPSRLGSLVESIDRLAQLYLQIGGDGDRRRAESLYREAMFRIGEVKEVDPEVQIGIVSLVAHFYDNAGQPERSIKYYHEALAIAQEAGLEDIERVGIFHNNTGMLHKKLGQSEEAEEHYHKALKIFRRVYGDESPQVASVLNNLGVLYYCQLDAERSLTMHEQALGIRQTLANGAGVSFDLGQTFNNLGAVYKAMGQFEKADQCVREAERCGVTSRPRNGSNGSNGKPDAGPKKRRHSFRIGEKRG